MKSKPVLIAAYVAIAAAIFIGATWGVRGYQQHQLVRQLPVMPDLQRWPVELSQRIRVASRDAGNPTKRVPALSDLALLYFANGYVKESAQVLALLRERDPQNPRWPHLQGILEERSRQRDKAIHSFRAVVQLAPEYAPAKAKLAELLLAAGQTDAARELHAQQDQAPASNGPDATPIFSKVASAEKSETGAGELQPMLGSQTSAPDDDPYVDQAYEYSYDTYRLQSFGEMRLLAQRYRSAIFFLRRAVTIDPTDTAVQEELAVAYIGLGQLGEARQVLEIALRYNPANDVLQARLTEVLINQNAPGEALAMLERNAAPSASSNARLLNARGEALAALERWSEAASAFEEAAKRNPVAPEFQFNLASCYLHLDKPEIAAIWTDRALKLHPGDLRGLALSTRASLDQGHFEEGVDTAHQLLIYAPRNSEYRTLFTTAALKAGNHCVEEGNDARAEQLYREGLAVDDKNGDLHGAVGVLLSIQRNFPAARSELETFLRLDPNNPLPYILLGSSLSDSGHAEAAQQIWQRGLDVAKAANDDTRISQLRALLAR